MTARVAGALLLAIALAFAVAFAACGDGGGSTAQTTTTRPSPVTYRAKVADSVVQGADQVASARARGASRSELAALSTAIVHVRDDGAIEVTIHGLQLVTPNVLDDLRRLGAEITDTASTPAVPDQPPTGLVQAWVPADQLPAVSELAWVAAVTAPAYPVGDTGG